MMCMKTKKFQRNRKKFGRVLKKTLKPLMVAKKLNMGKIFKKIRYESNDDLPLNKSIKILKDVGFKFEEHVCKKCHDLLTMAYSLKNIAILSAKGTIFRCLLMSISKNEGLKKLNNSVTYDRGVL